MEEVKQITNEFWSALRYEQNSEFSSDYCKLDGDGGIFRIPENEAQLIAIEAKIRETRAERKTWETVKDKMIGEGHD